MSENREIEMVFSSCSIWLKDWLEADEPILADEWDLETWMEHEMKDAVNTFLSFGFKTSKARIDALAVLRALFYEYFLFQQERMKRCLKANPDSVERLPKLQQSAQKSATWHAESREMLSGHEFGPVCVGSQSERLAVLMKKCAPEITICEDNDNDSRTVFLTSEDGKLSAFKWGWRYEPVARMLYEQCISDLDGVATTVFDGLGRIRHATLPRLGASPDGLITAGSRLGRLLEIKCPPTREMDNKVPSHYYCQMQLQAEVCDVEAVEYLEVQFSALPQEKATIEILKKGFKPWIGKICVCADNTESSPNDYRYEYSPLFPNTEEGIQNCLAWNPSGIILESSIWYIKNWFHTTVLRNKRWWDAIGYPAYMDFWKDVEMARSDGRFKPRALFVDSASEHEDDETSEEQVDNGPASHNTAVGSGETSSDGTNDVSAKRAGRWLGVD